MNRRGVTLVELMAACVLISFVVVGIASFLPRASKAAMTNRYLTTAKNLATGKIQELKQQPYSYLTPTGPLPNAAIANCDCSQLHFDLSDLAVDATVDDNGVVFKRRTCINFVSKTNGTNWAANCPALDSDPPPDNTDTGIKSIRTWVTFTFAGKTQTVVAESLVNRS